MANVIKLKRGTSTPTTSDIVDGEVAIDKSAQKFYVNDGGTVKEIGGGGGLESDAQNNTVGGTNAGDSFSGTSATDNTLIGKNTGTAVSDGDKNTALGSNALQTISSSYNNVAIGFEASKNQTHIPTSGGAFTFQGSNNTAVGFQALVSNTVGREITAIGGKALSSLTGDQLGFNTAVGFSSLASLTVARDNCAVGNFAGFAVTTGEGNTTIGTSAGKITTGSNNVCLGRKAGNSGSNITGSNNILIGYEAYPSSLTVSNEITLGDANITKLRIPALSFSISASAVTNGAAFYENAKTVAADYTLSGSNAMAAGPITINSNVTVTVSSGDTLTIV